MAPETLDDEEGEPVLKDPTEETDEDVRPPVPVGVAVEDWFVVGYGTTEVSIIEVATPETKDEWCLDFVGLVFLVVGWL
jgi:hypothetical protein